MSMVLKDCDKGRVYIPGENQFWKCRVDYSDDGIELYMEDYEGHGTEFGTRVDFFDEVVGVVVTDSEVKIVKNPDYPEIPERWIGYCRIRNIDTIVQRHLDVRVTVQLGIEFELEDGTTGVGTILNISAGGIYLVTDLAFPIGTKVSFRYSFQTMSRPYIVESLWSQRTQDGRFGYGCKFQKLTSGAESSVRSYVFGKMREQAKIDQERRAQRAAVKARKAGQQTAEEE